MNAFVLVYLLIVIFLFMVINILIYQLIVKKASRQFIKPFLNQNGIRFIKSEYVGFLKTGDFKESEFTLRPLMLGHPVHNTYVYVYYSSEKDITKIKRMTAKINSSFFFIRNVEYLPKVS